MLTKWCLWFYCRGHVHLIVLALDWYRKLLFIKVWKVCLWNFKFKVVVHLYKLIYELYNESRRHFDVKLE